MPDSGLYWRALAWLGALLLIGSMWPIICAARPFPSFRDSSANSPWNGNGTGTSPSPTSTLTNASSDRSDVLSVLNNASDFLTNQTETTPIELPVLSARREHPMAVVRIPRRPYDSHRVTAETIRSIQRRNQPRMHIDAQFIRRNKNDMRRTMATGEAATTTTTTITVPSTDVNPLNDPQTTTLTGLNLESTTKTSDSTTIAIEMVKQHVFNLAVDSSTDSPSRTTVATSTEGDDGALDNVTLNASKHLVIVASATKQSTIRSVFLDYVNFNEKTTLPIDIMFKTTTKNSETLPRSDREAPSTVTRANKRKKRIRNNTNLDRNERSANLSLAKTSKRMQLLIKSRLLQLLPDGTVNGTQNDESDYSKLAFLLFLM